MELPAGLVDLQVAEQVRESPLPSNWLLLLYSPGRGYEYRSPPSSYATSPYRYSNVSNHRSQLHNSTNTAGLSIVHQLSVSVFIDGDYISLSSPGKDTGTVSGNLVQESARVIKEVSHLNTSSVT